jgi:PIN domain nuclease of toxin-antitoxin system
MVANREFERPALLRLPWFADRRDPFDRILFAQAASEAFVLITVDEKLGRYGDVVSVM